MIRDLRNEDLRVGDVVHAITWKRITAIRPYKGPHDFIFAIVDTVPGVGFSLERGGFTMVETTGDDKRPTWSGL